MPTVGPADPKGSDPAAPEIVEASMVPVPWGWTVFLFNFNPHDMKKIEKCWLEDDFPREMALFQGDIWIFGWWVIFPNFGESKKMLKVETNTLVEGSSWNENTCSVSY